MFAMTIKQKEMIFIVDHLSDRAFNAGFRILNPEFKATQTQIKADKELLEQYLNQVDEQDDLGFKQAQAFYRDIFARKKAAILEKR